jgi:hypothetical protein
MGWSSTSVGPNGFDSFWPRLPLLESTLFENCGFRNFCGTNFAETNKVHQVTKVQRDLPYKALIMGRNDISK